MIITRRGKPGHRSKKMPAFHRYKNATIVTIIGDESGRDFIGYRVLGIGSCFTGITGTLSRTHISTLKLSSPIIIEIIEPVAKMGTKTPQTIITIPDMWVNEQNFICQ